MAQHKVRADIGTFDVGIVDVIFQVIRNRSVLGKLKVSQGGVEWQRAHDKKYVHLMDWAKMENLFVIEGRRVRKSMVHGPFRKRRA